MLFKEIIGHSDIKQKLIQTVQENRISHAQLFHGKEGTGALALALAYAQFINCLNKKEDDSCGTCSSCIKFQKLIHPDLHFAFPIYKLHPAPKKTLCDEFISQWRELFIEKPYFTLNNWYEFINIENKQGTIFESESGNIIKKLMMKSFEAEYKTMIIWLPEKMNPVSANKLLKLIEEPPPKTLILLVAIQINTILPTILSRTAQVKVPEINSADLFNALKKNSDLPDDEINNIIKISGGSFSDALLNIEQSDDQQFNFDNFVMFMRLAWKNKSEETLKWVENIAMLGREKQKSFLKYGMHMIRENFVFNLKQSEIQNLNSKEEEWSVKLSPFINSNNVQYLNKEFNDAHYHIERNANSKIVFFDLNLKVAKLLKIPK